MKVVVCGTTFGQFYMAALRGEFELTGILANGSARSVACAARHGVPLYKDISELPDDIDAACVVVRSGVMGGAGSELARSLLARGVHVLQEQPVHHDDVAACLRAARESGVSYRLGDLYVRLPAVRQFVAAARALLAERPAVYVDAACSIQVAFPLVHILGEALGSVRPWRFQGQAGDPFAFVTGVIGGVPLSLRVHNQVDPTDPDNHIHLLHRITIGTESGSLTLADTHGPVLWSPRLHIPDAVKNAFDFTGDHLGEPSTTVLGHAQPPSYREILAGHWPAAIAEDLALGRAGADAQYHLTLCRVWQDLTSQLGYPTLRPGQSHRPFPVSALLAAGAQP